MPFVGFTGTVKMGTQDGCGARETSRAPRHAPPAPESEPPGTGGLGLGPEPPGRSVHEPVTRSLSRRGFKLARRRTGVARWSRAPLPSRGLWLAWRALAVTAAPVPPRVRIRIPATGADSCHARHARPPRALIATLVLARPPRTSRRPLRGRRRLAHAAGPSEASARCSVTVAHVWSVSDRMVSGRRSVRRREQRRDSEVGAAT